MKRILTILVFLLTGAFQLSFGQIPVEVFGGNRRNAFDVMFFKFFKDSQDQTTPWLFFSRSRASIDYRMTDKQYLPQFGLTEAISYNAKSLKGFAPVAVGQILSTGVKAKAGIQYAYIGKELTVFSWLVADANAQTDLDYFLLLRYTPQITETLKLFTQFESLNVLPLNYSQANSFTQRYRVGLSKSNFQAGIGLDINHLSNSRQAFPAFSNIGLFIRNEF